jgi:hypothetical protein
MGEAAMGPSQGLTGTCCLGSAQSSGARREAGGGSEMKGSRNAWRRRVLVVPMVLALPPS